MATKSASPWLVKLLAGLLILLGGFAGVGSLMLWGQGFLFAFPADYSSGFTHGVFLHQFSVIGFGRDWVVANAPVWLRGGADRCRDSIFTLPC